MIFNRNQEARLYIISDRDRVEKLYILRYVILFGGDCGKGDFCIMLH